MDGPAPTFFRRRDLWRGKADGVPGVRRLWQGVFVISTTGIIPEDLMDPRLKADVIRWLTAQPYDGYFKRRLLEGWAITVGVRVRGRDFALVVASGIDYQG